MAKIAQTRHEVIIQRTLKQYNNLKEIRDKIDGKSATDQTKASKKNFQIQLRKETQDLGTKILGIVEKESVYRPPPDEKTLKKQRLEQLDIKQPYMSVKQINNIQTKVMDGVTTQETIYFPVILPNPKDKNLFTSRSSVNFEKKRSMADLTERQS